MSKYVSIRHLGLDIETSTVRLFVRLEEVLVVLPGGKHCERGEEERGRQRSK